MHGSLANFALGQFRLARTGTQAYARLNRRRRRKTDKAGWRVVLWRLHALERDRSALKIDLSSGRTTGRKCHKHPPRAMPFEALPAYSEAGANEESLATRARSCSLYDDSQKSISISALSCHSSFYIRHCEGTWVA